MKVFKIELIGSRARGDFRADSDWDFMVYSDWETESPYFGGIQFPATLPESVMAEIRGRVPDGAAVDIFLQFHWRSRTGCAVLYAADGEIVWNDAHGCAGGWLYWEGGDFPNTRHRA